MAIGSHGRGRGGTVGDGRLAIGRRRGKALFVFVRGLSELLLQSTNGDCSDVCSSPGLRSAHVAVRCGEYLGDFAERMLHFSQKHTLRPTVNATRL